MSLTAPPLCKKIIVIDPLKYCTYNKPAINSLETSFNEEPYDEISFADEYEKNEINEDLDEQSIDPELGDVALRTESQHVLKLQDGLQTDDSLSQNKTRCGFVNISNDLKDEYTIECCFCDSEFPLDLWFEFSEHVKVNHTNKESTNTSPNVGKNSNEIDDQLSETNLITTTVSEVPMNHDMTLIMDDSISYASHNIFTCREKADGNLETNDTLGTADQLEPIACTESTLDNAQLPVENTDDRCAYVITVADSIDDDNLPNPKNFMDDDHSYSRNLPTVENALGKRNHIRLGKSSTIILLDFLNELKCHPYLWYTQLTSLDVYEAGLEEVVDTMNKRWNLLLTKDSLPHDIELIRNWYNANLKKRLLNREFQPEHETFYLKCSEFAKTVNDSYSLKILCDLCQQLCFGEIGLQVHLFDKHGIGELPYKCNSCGDRYDNLHYFQQHMKNHRKQEDILLPPGKPFSCGECGKKFSSERGLNTHMEMHNKGERPYDCDVCGLSFRTRSVCKAHRKRHFPAQYECEFCPKKFHLVFQFKEHLKEHKCQQDYICELCGEKFVRQRAFKEHVVHIHNKEGLCNICGRLLKNVSSLDKHRKAFHRPLIGLPEKLHERLINRQKIAAEYRKCKYKFIIDEKTKKRRILCPDCGKDYFAYDSLYAHIRKIHGYEPPKWTKNFKSKPVGRWRKATSENSASINNKIKGTNNKTSKFNEDNSNSGHVTYCKKNTKVQATGKDSFKNNNACDLPSTNIGEVINELISEEVTCAQSNVLGLNDRQDGKISTRHEPGPEFDYILDVG